MPPVSDSGRYSYSRFIGLGVGVGAALASSAGTASGSDAALSSVPLGFSSASGSADGSGDGCELASTVPESSSGGIGGSSDTVSSIDATVSIGGLSAASSANAVSGKAVMSTSTASNTASDLLSFLIF